MTIKAWEIREGIKPGVPLGTNHLVLEGDNLVANNFLKNVWKIPWQPNNIVFDVGMDIRAFSSISSNHCFPVANQAAYFFAHKGHSVGTPHRWFELHDLVFLSIIKKDVLGWYYVRG